MLVKGTMVTELSGSVGGLTASHNRGGYYLRQRVIPVNPNSPEQIAVRSRFAALASSWLDELTPAERTSWNLAAAAILVQGRIGSPIFLSGQQLYMRNNTVRLQAALDKVKGWTGPYNNGNPNFEISMGAPDASAGNVAINYGAVDTWIDTDDAALAVYLSRGVNPSLNFFNGPYRFAAAVLGDATTPPTSPATVALPFPVLVGQKVFGYARVTYPDGRLSTPFQFGEFVVA